MLAFGRGRSAVAAAGIWSALAVGGLAFFVRLVCFVVGGRGLDHFTSTWVYDGLELAAVAAIAARAAFVRSERPAWVLMAVGVGSWTLGDISWTVVYAGHPRRSRRWPTRCTSATTRRRFVALALLVRFRLSRFSASIWLDGLMAALAVAAVGAAVLVDVIINQTHGGLVADATNLAYPLGDIVLLGLLAGVFALAGWRPGLSFVAIAVALVLNVLADSLYLYQSAVGGYYPGWQMGY